MELSRALAETFGLQGNEYRHNVKRAVLFEEAIAHDRGRIRRGGPADEPEAWATALGMDGPLIYYSDPDCTGRPTGDTFAVAGDSVDGDIWWKKDFQRFDPDAFDALRERVIAHLNARGKHLYVQDTFCGWDPDTSVPYRLISEYATHILFAQNVFVFVDEVAVADIEARRWTLINVPSFVCEPARDATLSQRAVIIDLANRLALVLGPADYCSIVKKTLFTVMNFGLPARNELPMHHSANVGPAAIRRFCLGSPAPARPRYRPIPIAS